MEKYSKEIGVLFIQLFMFYIFPLFIYLYEPIGTVMLILLTTLILYIILSIVSKNKIKYIYIYIYISTYNFYFVYTINFYILQRISFNSFYMVSRFINSWIIDW